MPVTCLTEQQQSKVYIDSKVHKIPQVRLSKNYNVSRRTIGRIIKQKDKLQLLESTLEYTNIDDKEI